MKPNQMFIGGTRQFTISAERSNNHQAFNGYQLCVFYQDAYQHIKADNISVSSEVFNSFDGSGLYDVVLGMGTKPVVLSIKKAQSIAF